MPQTLFLKLGGSLITDKDSPMTARLDVLDRLAGEISAGLTARPDLRLVIGHGSGSFGHVAARKFGTHQGSQTREQWLGFCEVWYAARRLNQIVIESLYKAGLPVIAFPPSASVVTADRQVVAYDFGALKQALDAGLVPVVNGDVIFDLRQGSTILSTEEIFAHLAPALNPARILLAGREPGVWADFPDCTKLLAEITPANLEITATGLKGSASVDVTGGMLQKVKLMVELVKTVPGLEIVIFTGKRPGLCQQALAGGSPGSTIRQA
jgi:isopentenyl phosphate kinase